MPDFGPDDFDSWMNGGGTATATPQPAKPGSFGPEQFNKWMGLDSTPGEPTAMQRLMAPQQQQQPSQAPGGFNLPFIAAEGQPYYQHGAEKNQGPIAPPQAAGPIETFLTKVSPGADLIHSAVYSAARKRIEEGKDDKYDRATVANYQQMQQDRQNNPWSSAAGGAVGFAGDLAATGGAAKALGFSGKAVASGFVPWLSAKLSHSAASAALMPSTWANIAEKNVANGKEATDLSGAPGELAMTTAQMAVGGSLGKLLEGVGGEGVKGAIGRWAGRTVAGHLEMQALDAVAGKTSEYLPEALKMRTGYGSFADLLQGKEGAARENVIGLLNMGAFSLGHGIQEQGEFAQAKADRRANAEQMLQDYADAYNSYARRGYSSAAAAEKLKPAIETIQNAAKTDTPYDKAVESIPADSPARSLAEKLASSMPERPPAIQGPKSVPPGPSAAAEAPTAAPSPPEASGAKPEPFSDLQPDQIQQLSEQLTGKPLRTAAGLATELKRRGLSDQGLAQVAESMRPQAPSRTIDVSDWYRGEGKAPVASAEKTDALIGELRKHQESGGSILMSNQDKAEPFPVRVQGDRLVDRQGKQWGLLAQAMSEGKLELAPPTGGVGKATFPVNAAVEGSGVPGYGLKELPVKEEATGAPPPAPETRSQVAKAFTDSFEGAKKTGRANEWKAEFGGRTVYVDHDPETNLARIDFTWSDKPPEGTPTSGPGAGIPADVQPDSLSFMRGIRRLARNLNKAGSGVTYTAQDGRADHYRRIMEGAGFEQATGPTKHTEGTATYSWKPKESPGAPPGTPDVQPPVDRMAALRRKQQSQGPIQAPGAKPALEAPEPLTEFERQAEERTNRISYEDVPSDLRDRVEGTVKALEGLHPAEAIRESARAAFAGGGEEGLRAMLDMQEARLKPPSTEDGPKLQAEHVRLMKEFDDAVEDAVRDAVRRGRSEASVRREVEGVVRQATKDAGLADSPETPSAPAEGNAGGEPASAGQPQAGGNLLSPDEVAQLRQQENAARAKRASAPPTKTERMNQARMRKEYPGVFQQAKEMGLEEGHVHQLAKESYDQDKQGASEHNDWLKAVRGELARYGTTPQQIARTVAKGGDATQLAGMDVAAESFFKRRPDLLRPEENPADGLARILGEGNREPGSMEEHYEQALEQLKALKEASRATPEEIAAVNQELRWGGDRSATAEDISGAEEQARRAGVPSQGEDFAPGEATRAEAERPETGDTSFGFGGPEPAAGQPAGGSAGGNPADGSGQPAGPPGAGQPPIANVPGMRPKVADPIQEAAEQWVKDQSGALNLPVTAGVVREAAQILSKGMQELGDNLREFAGEMYPRATRLDRESGEAMARHISSPVYAKKATISMIDKVLGPNATEADMRKVGGVLTEMRLRHMRDQFNQAGHTQAAQAVKSIVGAQDSPFQTDAEFQAAVNDPKVKQAIDSWKKNMVPMMEDFFRRAQGMEDTDPINSPTQIPGMPVNLKAIREGDPLMGSPVYTGPEGKGNLANTKLRRYGFAKAAEGNAGGYDIDLGRMIENALTKGAKNANKADMFRQLEAAGLAQWAKPGERVRMGDKPAVRIPDVKPPAGTQEAQFGQTDYYAHADIADEFKNALDTDRPSKTFLTKAMQTLTAGNVASTAEAAFHTANNMTFLSKNKVSAFEFFNNVFKVFGKDPGAAEEIAELARIGAMKDDHPGVPGTVSGSNLNPFKWTSRFLSLVDKSMRLTANDAFDKMVATGKVEDTETNRRNFVNQLGQYNRQAQNSMVRVLRDTGLGPFATAGTNYIMQGARAVMLNPGVKATSAENAISLRAEQLARYVAVIGGAAAANYLAHGRVDGDDKTPLGAIKLGTAPNGDSIYWDVTGLFSPIKRGARETGLLALAEGKRAGATNPQIADKAVQQTGHALLHPLVGPAAGDVWTAFTGKDVTGRMLAKKAPPGGSQALENLKAAVGNINPIGAVATGADEQKEKKGGLSKWWKLLGPFGPRESSRPPGAPPQRR